MKKIKTLFPTLLLTVLATVTAHATHLEGLWRNDRQNITIRIEDSQDGFRARRIDQGIWYTYTTRDGHQYYDRYGNYYEVWNDDEIAWNETASGKRIRFSRVSYTDEHNYNERDYVWERHDHHDAYNYPPQPAWVNSWDVDYGRSLDGRWVESYRGHELEIECFRGGIKVKREHSGWEKYFPAHDRSLFVDRFGNTIRILDHNSIRWNSYHGGPSRIFHRRDGFQQQGNCR